MEELFSFIIAAPKIGVGKYKNQLPTINNAPIWYRYGKTRIKNDYKEKLTEWFLPKSELMLDSFIIEFSLFRPNGKKLDADALFYIYKWTIDSIVEQGYAKDDNKVKIIINPAILEKKNVETTIKVKVIYEKRV